VILKVTGTFQTYLIERTMYVQPMLNATNFTLNIKVWVDPRYGFPIKREEMGRSGGRIVRSDRYELVSIKADRI